MQASVVLVDDHQLLRDGLRKLIESSDDFTVVAEAADGREAVEKALEFEPDIVLMDIWMPLLSGIEATAQIKQRLPRCRVLVMSQHESPKFIQAALREGASGYAVKTTGGAELLGALRAVLQGKGYLSPDVARHVVDSFAHPEAESASPLQSLSHREREILQLIAEGLSSKEIAERLYVSTRTVESHRANVMSKLDIRKVAGLVRFAIREGLISP